jgi:hypothetical protein
MFFQFFAIMCITFLLPACIYFFQSKKITLIIGSIFLIVLGTILHYEIVWDSMREYYSYREVSAMYLIFTFFGIVMFLLAPTFSSCKELLGGIRELLMEDE